MEAKPYVTLFVDPACPFGWTAAQWMLEVESQGRVNLTFRQMSLSVLNEHRDLEPWYREFNDRAWLPARVHAAAVTEHGNDVLRELYLAVGRRRHIDLMTDWEKICAQALAEVGLPSTLLAAAKSPTYEAQLRRRHQETVDLLGPAAGCPTLIIDEQAIFGPVLTAIPRGDEATRLFDSIRTVATYPDFAELKRERSAELKLA